MDDTSAREINRFTENTYAEMSAWEDSETSETDCSVTLSYTVIVALAFFIGGVAYWLRWAHV